MVWAFCGVWILSGVSAVEIRGIVVFLGSHFVIMKQFVDLIRNLLMATMRIYFGETHLRLHSQALCKGPTICYAIVASEQLGW